MIMMVEQVPTVYQIQSTTKQLMVPGSRLPTTSIHVSIALQSSNGTEYSPPRSPQLQ